jgi:hypothetical protein
MKKNYEVEDFKITVYGEKKTENESMRLEAIVITSKSGQAINRSDAKDISEAMVRMERAKEEKIDVFAEQKDGKFDQYKWKVESNAYNRYISTNNEELKKGVTKEEVKNHISGLNSQFEKQSLGENLRRYRDI